jgi:CubicO group peptidase (beta-lactamase class C family)
MCKFVSREFALMALACCAAQFSVAQNAPVASPETEQHIEHVTSGLTSDVVIKGDEHATHMLADRMNELNIPGVSIAVIHEGKIEWARGFGVSSIGGSPVTPETMFQAGSISKPLAAMAALRLVEQGKLSLDADINTFLTTWKFPADPVAVGKPVTLRELLTHTGGTTVHGFPGYASTEPVPTLVQVLNGEKPANTPAIRSEAVPGAKWNYSGGGYTIMQQALIDVTKEPFPKLLHDTVLAPIGMTQSTYEQPLPKEFQAYAATPYSDDGKPVNGGAHTYPEMAAAGLWTTPTDLARYAIEVQKSLEGKANHVLSVEMTRQMLIPGMGQWGLGLEIRGAEADPYLTHGGVNEGFVNNFAAYEKNGEGAVVMTNSANGGLIASEILHSIAAVYGWPDFQPTVRTIVSVDPKILAQYAGVYALAPTFDMTITLVNGQLISQATRQGKVPLFAESKTMFFRKDINAEIEFSKDEKGPASQLILHQNGRDMTGKRLDDAEAKKIADGAAAFDKRFKDQTALPGSEPAVRRMIGELQTGKPNYDLMSPSLAEVIRQQLPRLQSMVVAMGALQSVIFKGVGPGGADIYQVNFEKGSIDYRIWLGAQGKTESANLRTTEYPAPIVPAIH